MLNKSRKNDAKVVGLSKERRQKARAALFNCISALVCQDTQESIALGCVLNPQCTPTGPSHSLHARAVTALFACSHSICDKQNKSTRYFKNTNLTEARYKNSSLPSLTCIYLVLSAWCPARNPGRYLALGSQRAPQWHFPGLPGCSDKPKMSDYFLPGQQQEKRQLSHWSAASAQITRRLSWFPPIYHSHLPVNLFNPGPLSGSTAPKRYYIISYFHNKL